MIVRWVGCHDGESVACGVMCSLAPLSSTQVVGARSSEAGCEINAEVHKYEWVNDGRAQWRAQAGERGGGGRGTTWRCQGWARTDGWPKYVAYWSACDCGPC